jgi:hypothetical protein
VWLQLYAFCWTPLPRIFGSHPATDAPTDPEQDSRAVAEFRRAIVARSDQGAGGWVSAMPCCACAIVSCRPLTVAADTAGWAAEALTSAHVLTPCRCERQVNSRMRQFLRLALRLQPNRSSATHPQSALVSVRSFQLEHWLVAEAASVGSVRHHGPAHLPSRASKRHCRRCSASLRRCTMWA